MVQRDLSKSKLIAFRQCSKRLWLEVHRPQLSEVSNAMQAIFDTGHQVGQIAQHLYDPQGQGAVIDLHAEGVGGAIERTQSLLGASVPIFEAGFAAAGGMAFVDVLLPVQAEGRRAWRMVEVKSSASVKEYHQDDIAIQAYVARSAGVDLVGAALAHIDTGWCYGGDGNFDGLLVEKDLTEIAFSRENEVRDWIASAQAVVVQLAAPDVATGPQCTQPFPCGFSAYCHQVENRPEYPVTWLPRIQSGALKTFISEHSGMDMRDVPSYLLNERQRLVRDCTLRNECFFDEEGAKRDLTNFPLPAYFLDFETIQFAVPRWAGTRPFQILPFQFSLHHLDAQGVLSHQEFLYLSGNDPSSEFAQRLISLCAEDGPIFVYNSGFEGSRIAELAHRFADLRDPLLALKQRLVDLLPIAQAHFYHPSQQGSWSIKKLLPAIFPEFRYDTLTGVQDGESAMQAYLEAIDPEVTCARKQEIHAQLMAYCELDTLAMVKIWEKFIGYP